MADAPIYEARGVTKSYGSVQALTDVDLSIRAGEIVGLVGDNGAGKSTLVKVLSGAHQPDSGSVYLDGVARAWKSPHEALEAGIETLYQDSGLCPDLTVSGNVFLGREKLRPGLLGKLGFLDNKAMARVAHEELERAGIGLTGVRRNVNQLSGGQRQAVAIGRAVAWARKVIVLDEPTNHLGARQSGEVLKVVAGARERGLGVVFISHTPARAPGDRPHRRVAPRPGGGRRADILIHPGLAAEGHHRTARHRDGAQDMTVRLQLAIDAPEHLALIPRVGQYFDVIEVGTPVLKRFGLAAISTVRELGGGKPVLADTKTADGGAFEAEMIFAAGAAMMTVLAHASLATRRNADEVAQRYGGEVVLDTILDGGLDVEPLLDGRPPQDVWLALHAPSDARRAGVGTEDHIDRVAQRRQRGFRVSLAGGIRRANLARALEVAPEIVVIGSGVTEATDPEGEAAWIRTQVDASTPGI